MKIQNDHKNNFKILHFSTVIFILYISFGCRTFRTNPLSYNGLPKYQHSAKITKSRKVIESSEGKKDTLFAGVIKTRNSENVHSEYHYKTRILTTESGRFYYIEFTKTNSEYAGSMSYDIKLNQVPLGPSVRMYDKHLNKGFTKELLADSFFLWLNKEYYNR
jgi:hypothetical protein